MADGLYGWSSCRLTVGRGHSHSCLTVAGTTSDWHHAIVPACLCAPSRERKKTPYLGKHTKKVVCMAWNKDNRLAMAGADKIVSMTQLGCWRKDRRDEGGSGMWVAC